MITTDNSIEGNYFDGITPLSCPASLILQNNEAELNVGETSKTYIFNDLLISPKTGGTKRFISFPDGGQYQCNDHQLLDQLPQEVRSENIVAWLETRVFVAVLSVIFIVFSLLLAHGNGR